MSPAPIFQMSLWNAWIFMVWCLLPLPFVLLFHKGTFRKTSSTAPLNKNEKTILGVSKIVMFFLFIYSIFLPLQGGTIWFYVGLPIYLFGLIMYTIVWLNIVASPPDQPVTRGLYRYSRHPMYLTHIPIFGGVGIVCASWLFLVASVLFIILHCINGIAEERLCLEVYGDTYREYINRTPRWLGRLKSNGR